MGVAVPTFLLATPIALSIAAGYATQFAFAFARYDSFIARLFTFAVTVSAVWAFRDEQHRVDS